MYNTLDVLSTAREEEESNIDKEIVSHNTQSPFEEPKETLQLKTKNEPAISDEILAQLVAMGFELSLAQIAVNENKGCGFDATLQWLLQQQSYQNDNGHDEEIKVPIKHSTENFYSKNVESNPALKIKLTPYRRPISTANATPPKKGILKPPPPPNTRSLWKRDWLSTLNIRLQNAANSASTTAAPNTTASFFSSALKRLNSPTTFSYITQQEELQQMPQQNQKQPPHVNPTTPADQISQYNSQNSSLSSNTNLLTPKALKRVRFSVAKLTDEYPHSPIPGESDNSDWEDEYDFREWNEKQKKTSQTLPEAEQKRVYTPRDMMKFYLAACRNREEFPADRLVDIFKKACQPGGSLNVIDLTGDIIDKKIAEPIADILTLEFGLQKLIMERCEIEEDTMKIICHSLLVNDSLPYLNLSNNKRLRTNGFNYIAVYIKKSLTLAYLDLSGINIDKKSATFLAQALIQGNNKSGAVLETLNLDNCGLKNNVLEVLGPGIRRSNLRNLSLRFNRINHVGAVWIGVMLRDYEDLNLGTNNAQLSPSMPPFNEQEEARAEKLRSRKRGIEVLNITGNDLRSGIQYIAQALRRNRSLKELHMQENRIDPKGLAILADGLKYNHTLELLNISKNPVGGPSSEGIIAIRNGLSLNTTLKGLFLSNINLSSEGAIAIAEYLPETNSLVHLDLTSNPDIDIAGVLALAVSIKMNHSVRVLDVNVQPNDNEMARLSRDILRACVRNTELAQKSDSENSENGFLLADFETKSHSVLSGITGSSDFDESSELSLGIYVEDLKKNVKVGKENLKAFEELLATDEKISFTEKVEANEMINQLHDQCKNIQAKIRPYIAAVTDESLLEELLTLNDNLSNAFQKYEKIYNNHEIFQNPKPIISVAAESNDDDHDNIITTIETSPITIVTSPTSPSVTSPTFSIGDSDDDGDFDNIALSEGSSSSRKIPPSLKIESLLASDIDIHSQKSPKSPLEEMNKLLEVEEGQVLRKAREVFEQDIEETESSPLDQLSGEELKLQLLDEPNLS